MIYVNSYFIFKGVKSTDYNITVERQPDIARAERQITEFTIPGKSGELLLDEGAFKSVIKTAECGLLSPRYLDEISAWLTGAGEAVFSNEPDKAYDAFIKSPIVFTRAFGRGLKKFSVSFKCRPFKRSVSEADEGFTLNAPGSFTGRGTVASAPVITIYGGGDITLYVNGGIVQLADVSGYVTLDSDVMECFKGNVNMNPKMIGEFPELSPGGNSISWSGNVSCVEVLPRWRWL